MKTKKSHIARRFAGTIVLGAALVATAAPAVSASAGISAYGTVNSCKNADFTDCKPSSFAVEDAYNNETGFWTDCYQWAKPSWAILGYAQRDLVHVVTHPYPRSAGAIYGWVGIEGAGGFGANGCNDIDTVVWADIDPLAPGATQKVTLNLTGMQGYGSAHAVVTVKNGLLKLASP